MTKFFERYPKPSLVPKIVKWLTGTSTEAAKAPPIVKGDGPITIHCGGREEYWGSRWLAFHYYTNASMACEGSERGRYLDVAAALLMGANIPSDGIPIRKTS